jgi:ATP-dependent RNA helicase DDX35
MRKRGDLKIIICSATVDAEEIKLYFDEGTTNNKKSAINKTTDTHFASCIISVEGRYYPVEIKYLDEPCDNYIKASVLTSMAIHLKEKSNHGDILIFLTGQDEVDEAVSMLIEHAKDLSTNKKHGDQKKLWILPLYGSLPVSEQLKVFERTPKFTRKIIVATNIAETSLTIEGIVHVIDCGFMKIKAYDSKLGMVKPRTSISLA